jgi:NADPH-dependent 2,4-dienoyl-CoA reductase/sulfur reductase-like enzyme
MRFLIIGGSDAGISAALRARQIAPGVEVTVVLADAFPNFSICGLPFFLSGETPDWRTLAHRTEFDGIELLTNCTAREISFDNRSVEIAVRDGHKTLRYDRLLIATGAYPAMPRISGLNLEGLYPLHTMEDSFRIQEHLNRSVRSAVLVGVGYIGLEMADALVHRGMSVTLVGRSGAVLPTVDSEWSKRNWSAGALQCTAGLRSRP